MYINTHIVHVHHSKQFVNTGIGEKKVRDKIII